MNEDIAPHEFLEWLANIQPGADASLIATNTNGKITWILHAAGLPEHVREIHVEGPSAVGCVRAAKRAIANLIARRLMREAEERAQRCPYWSKKRFPTEGEAIAALDTLSRTHNYEDHIPTATYFCDPEGPQRGCGQWHLTSHPRGRRLITEPLKPQDVHG